MAEDSEPKTEGMPKSVEMVYRDAVDNIRFVKAQQWRVAHYAVLAYGVVATLAITLKATTWPEKTLLLVIAIIAWVASVLVISLLQHSRKKFRERLTHIYKSYFSERERCDLVLSLKSEGFWQDWSVLLCLFGASTLGAAIAIYLIYRC